MVAEFTRKALQRLGGWIGARLVQDVPEDIAACEFDCSKLKCDGPELLNCERRIRSEAAELRERETDVAAQPNSQAGGQPGVSPEVSQVAPRDKR